MVAVSALATPSLNTYTGSRKEPHPTHTELNDDFTAIQDGVTDLQSVMLDRQRWWAAGSAPTDNTVAGKLFMHTGQNQLLLAPDASGCDQALSRVIHSDLTAVSRTTPGALMSTTIPANTLKADKQYLRITAWGTNALTSATLQIRFAGAVITSFKSPFGNKWRLVFLYVRTGASSQDWVLHTIESEDDREGFSGESGSISGNMRVDVGTDSEDTTASISFDLNASSISDGSITQEGLRIELLG